MKRPLVDVRIILNTLIERRKCFEHPLTNSITNSERFAEVERLYSIVENLPTVDAVPVVRCKNCKYRGDFSRCPMAHIGSGDPPYDENEDYTTDNGYCHYGKEKDG